MERPRPVSDLGFDEPADGVLCDGYRVDHLAAAGSGRERFDSAYAYLLKTLKNGTQAAGYAADWDMLKVFDDRCERLAGQIVAVVSELEAEMRARGYDHDR